MDAQHVRAALGAFDALRDAEANYSIVLEGVQAAVESDDGRLLTHVIDALDAAHARSVAARDQADAYMRDLGL